MTAAFSLTIAVLMFTASSGLVWYARHSAQLNADSLLKASIRKAQAEINESNQTGSLEKLIGDEREEDRADNLKLELLDSSGRHLFGKNVDSLPLRSTHSWRVATGKLRDNTLLIGMPWSKTEAALRYHAIVLLSLALFTVVVAAAGAWVLVGRTLLPISSLSRQANCASVDSLSISLEQPSRDSEIVELVATLNKLLIRLSQAATAKGRFYSAASHRASHSPPGALRPPGTGAQQR